MKKAKINVEQLTEIVESPLLKHEENFSELDFGKNGMDQTFNDSLISKKTPSAF